MQGALDPRNPVPVPGQPRPPLLKALTSIRIFAALHVALYHLVRPFELWGPLAPVFRVGYVGVSFFFLLSGFILTYSHAAEYKSGRGNKPRFWMARFARVYPVYLLSMLLAAYTGRIQFAAKTHIIAYIADLFMMQSWYIRLTPFFNVPAWSLSEEAFFYALFPFVLMPLMPRTRTRAWLSFAALWLLAIAVPLLSLHMYPQAGWSEGIYPGGRSIYFVRRFPPILAFQFFAGIALAWIFMKYRPSRRTTLWLGVAGTLGLVAALFASDHLPFVVLHDGLLIPLFAAIILGLSEDNWFSRLMSAPPLVLLGEASFALYLFHFFLSGYPLYPGGESTVASALLKLCLLIPASIAIHLWVERPCRKWILTWNARRMQRTHSA